MLVDILCCRFKIGKYGMRQSSREPLLENHPGSDTSDLSGMNLYNNTDLNALSNPVHLAEQNVTYDKNTNSNFSGIQEEYGQVNK